MADSSKVPPAPSTPATGAGAWVLAGYIQTGESAARPHHAPASTVPGRPAAAEHAPPRADAVPNAPSSAWRASAILSASRAPEPGRSETGRPARAAPQARGRGAAASGLGGGLLSMLWSSPLAARRRVFVGLPQPAQLSASEGRPLARFPPNRIRTSKYTLVTFLPKNLFEQFRRAANFYFLLMIVMQGLPIFQISSTPWIPALPLIVIVTVTAIKDLVEDYRRQVSDRQLNNASALILRDVDNPNYPRKEPRQARTDSAPESVTKLLGADACNWGSTTWNALRVGDFVLLPGGSRVPADIILLSSSHLDGVAFVETKNLDGETNLKTVEAIPETAEFRTGADCRRLRLIIDSEPPSINLYSYNAAICVFPPDEPPLTAEQMLAYGDMNSPLPANPRPLPVNASNLLLRGSVVRNIDYVIGVVVFTGQDTKVILNAGATPSKRSNIEKRMNLQVAINFVILLALCLSITLLEGYSLRPRAPKPPSELLNYLNNTVASKVIVFGASIIMLQNIVPISLYVTLEFIKSFQSFFIYQDIEMYDEELDETCIPKSWNITDDLGQIEYIFSDKTGTLTRNKMEFRRCSINGHVYGQGFTDVSADKAGVGEKEREELTQTRLKAMQQQMAGCVVNHLAHVTDTSFFDDTIFDRFRNNPSERAAIGAFFTVLAVCHTIPTPEPDSERKYKYNAQSPDESALVSCAHDMGFSFERRDLNRVYVDIHGSKECYEILHVLEFNSTRKRMSVVVRTEDGQVVLMTKGADSVICRRLAHGQDKKIDMTLAHLAEFAGEGLRTLCIAQRVISPEEFAAWSIIQQAASVSLVDRDRLLDESAERIEQNLVLLGATAIEDKLQEGVSTAIATLRSAGLKIWVLTGDKLETAINIGYASNLLSEEMTLLVVAGQTIDEISSQIGRALGHFVPATASSKQQPRRAADWFERINALRDQVLPSKATRAKRRMGIEKLVPIEPTIYGLVIDGDSLEFVLGSAPLRRMFLQLAVLCESIVCCRVSPKQKAQVVQLVQEGLGAMCLSIGDGANDVSMIQQAHIGIGISGKEGLQAALASDFVIGQFRFLSRLLMFHGHWAYYRISGSILNFFFKNMAWIMTMFWYQYYSGFTGIILYDYTYILLFNLIFTALPPLIIGVFDKDVSEARILTHPQIYQLGIRQFFFSYTKFFVYIIDAIYQAFISHYFALAIFGSEANRHGYASDRTILGTVAAMNTIVAINVSMLSNISSWSSIVVASMLLSAFSFIIFVPIASKVAKGSLLGVADELFTDVRLYLDLVVCTVACTLPRTALGLFRVMLAPTDMDVVREMRSSNSVVQDARLSQVEEASPPFGREIPGMVHAVESSAFGSSESLSVTRGRSSTASTRSKDQKRRRSMAAVATVRPPSLPEDAVAPTMWLTNRVNAIEMSDAPGTGPLQRRVSWAGAQHSVGNRAQFMEMAARPPPIVTGSDAQRRHVASSNFELASPQSTATLSMSPGGPNVRRVRSSMIHADSDRLPPREDSVIGRITAGRAPSPSRQSLRDGIPGTQIRFMGQSRSSLDEGQRRHTFDAYEGVADHHEQWTGFAFAADESAAARRMSFRLSMTSEQIASEMLGRTPSIRSASPTRSDDRSQSPVRGDVQPAMTPRMAMPISVAHAPAHVHNRPILQPQRSNPLMQSYLAHTPMSPAEAAPSQMRPAAPSTAQQQHPNQQHPPPPGL